MTLGIAVMKSEFFFYLVVTFTDTGAQSTYQFENMQHCKSAIPPMVQLYKGLKQPVSLVCNQVPRVPAEPVNKVEPEAMEKRPAEYAPPARQLQRITVKTKQSESVRYRYRNY